MAPNSNAKTQQALFFKNFELERVIHSIKTAAACLAGLLVIKLVGRPMDQWLLITVAVVMCAQINVGSVINKSYMRFLGTLSGSILAATTISLFGADIIPIVIIIAFAGMLFSYIATSQQSFNDSGTLGLVTVVVILLGPHPTIMSAFHRFMEISVGILIAALISQFMLPIRARDHLQRTQAKTLEQLRDFYLNSFMQEPTKEIIATYQMLDEEIVASLSSQRSLSKEALREPFGIAFDPSQFTRILRCEKEVFRSIVCMHYAYDMFPAGKSLIGNLSAVKMFHASMCVALDKISYCIQQKDFTHTPVTIPSLQSLKAAFMELNSRLSADDTVYVNGFLFCAEILIVHLTELVILLDQSRMTKKDEPDTEVLDI
jgi:hypothetical protein